MSLTKSANCTNAKMNWGVIPAIFFALIGRIVPGSLLMVLAVLIARGYREGIEDILKQASQVSTARSGLPDRPSDLGIAVPHSERSC
jgi:hypothetical protein